MKRSTKLLVLSGVMVVCVGGAVIVSGIDFEEKMKGKETAIISLDSSEITGLSWNYDGDISFTRTEEGWSYDGDEKMPVNQELMEEMAEALSDITSDKMVEDVKTLSIYGLSDPQYTVSVKTAEETYEIRIGSESFSDGEVYISIGDGYVYLTDSSLIDTISYALYDMVQEEEIPDMEQVTRVSIEKEEPAVLVYKEESGYCYSDAYLYYLEENGSFIHLDNELAQDTVESLTDFLWLECVDYYAEDSELEIYGLSEPYAVVTVDYINDEEEALEFIYEIGVQEGSYYARIQDSRMVYSIGSVVYTAAEEAGYDALRPQEAILLDWDTVDSLEVTLDGESYTVVFDRNGDTDCVYTLDGTEIEFETVLNTLSDMEKAENTEEDPAADSAGKEELAFIFHRNTAQYATVTLSFSQKDGSTCIAQLNGEEVFLVDRADVVDLREAINSILLDL